MAARPASVIFSVTPVDPPATGMQFLHAEDPPVLNRDVKWRTIERPRLDDAVEYTGTSLWTMSVPAVLSYADVDRSIEELMLQIQGRFSQRVPPRNEPPVLRVSGPSVPPLGVWFTWVLTKVTPGKEERNDDGTRNLAFFTFEFLQYVTPSTVLTVKQSAAQAAQQRARAAAPAPTARATPANPPTPSSRTYTVKSGDTLSKIAARVLGNAERWTDIAALNGIRDPKNIRVGQVLRLP